MDEYLEEVALTVKVNDGSKIPVAGLGTFKLDI